MDIIESYMKNASRYLTEDEDDEVVDTEEDTEIDTDTDIDDDTETDVEGEAEISDADLESMTKEELIDYIHELQDNGGNGMCPCPDCNGEGFITDEDGEDVDCETCGGTGEVACEDQEYELDLENPVCPCCGCKLNVLDDADAESEEDEDDDESIEDIDIDFDDDDE